ncbi:MAG TPA: LPS assembly protein LptD [Syntrophobacteria bacterium]|nr:LPS assembly protein LptD [Syntrophobacteria bacterium]
MGRLFALVGGVVAAVLGSAATLGAAAQSLMFDQGGKEPWHLEADEFTYDSRQGFYTARGNVILRSGDRTIKTDAMRLDALTHRAILEGHVRFQRAGDWLEGERANLDLDEEAGTIEGGQGFLAQNHFYFGGPVVEQLEPQVYHIESGTFTTCDGKDPSWHFRASDLEITVNGYGFAENAWFYAGPVPLFYAPYFVFPAKTERQSGFLPPQLGHSSRVGWFVDLPFYWAINDSADATLYTNYMTRNGLMEGGEFRYAASEKSKGLLRFDYIHDLNPLSRSQEQQDYDESAPGLLGRFKDRWWWRSKQDFTLPLGMTGKFDVDLVSDPYYLREFNTGYSGFKDSKEAFQQTFGRSFLNDETSTFRESTLQANKTWFTQSFNVDFHYYDNLDRTEDGKTLQALPLMTYGAVQQPLLGGPFFWQADGSYVDFYRPNATRGQRLDLQPRVALPLRWDPYLNLQPSVGARETLYLTNNFEGESNNGVNYNQTESRELYDVQVKASTDLARIFDTDLGSWRQTRHTVRPEVVYNYVPSVSQGHLPSFDSVDRIPDENLVTYGFTNFFTAKIEPEEGKPTYRDVAWVRLSQSYSLDKNQGNVFGEIVQQEHRFSDIGLEVNLTPAQCLSLTYQTLWSPYDDSFTRHELFTTLSDPRGDSLSLNYRKKEAGESTGTPAVNEIDGTLTVKLIEGLTFTFRRDYSYSLNQNIETDFKLALMRQCWGVTVDYINKPNNQTVSVSFTLTGIGQLKLL